MSLREESSVGVGVADWVLSELGSEYERESDELDGALLISPVEDVFELEQPVRIIVSINADAIKLTDRFID